MKLYSVLIVSGCPHATTQLYRCQHLQEQLALIGHQAVVRAWDGDIAGQVDVLSAFDLVVLQRVPMTRPLGQAIRRLQKGGGVVLFDTDDLVFVPPMASWHRAVNQLPASEQRLYHEGVRRYAATLAMSDAALVSTPLLAELARRQGKRAFVHGNALGKEMAGLAQRLYDERQTRPPAEQLVIGYGSGTATHDIDFQEAVPALLYVLATYPQVDLWLAGPLQLPPSLARFEARIRRLPLTSWQEWLQTASYFDINLAPLEQGNPFCRAKSAIKFSEAAALGIPTVASRIDPFAEAIEHGQTGYLANQTASWIEALDTLITNPQRRRRMGDCARDTVLARDGLETRAVQLAAILEAVTESMPRPQPALVPVVAAVDAPSGDDVQPVVAALPAAEEASAPVPEEDAAEQEPAPLVLNWVISEPIPGSGGFTNLFRIITYLGLFGHECRVYIVPVDRLRQASVAEIERFVTAHFHVRGARFYRWEGEVADADATIATYWETAHQVAGLHNGGIGCYLVQDFEPLFYPAGVQQIQAERSYQLGLHCITLGHWLARLLQDRYGATANAFDFALDHELFRPSTAVNPGRPPRVVFYARPSTPRRGYEIGIAALQLVHAARPDVEIVLYGADHLPNPPDFYHRNVGILNPYELANLYASADVGVVLSLTNPSLTPLEMMACGCAVVDIASERIEGLLHDGVDALLASPDADAIAGAILRLLHEPTLRAALVENGLREAGRRSWESSVRQIEDVLLAQIPPQARIRRRPVESGDADALTWQIHQLLDQRIESRRQHPVQPVQIQRLLIQTVEKEAERVAQLQAVEDQLHQLVGRSLLRRGWGWMQGTVRPLTGEGRAQLGSHRLYAHPLLGAPLHQRFVADRANLARVEVLPAPSPGVATRPLRLTVRAGDETGAVVVDRIFRAAEVVPNQRLGVDFEPQRHSYEQVYTVTLSSPGATSSDYHCIWRFPGIVHGGARLSQAGRHLPGQLAFQWYSDHPDGRLAPRTGPRQWDQPVEPLPHHIAALRRGLGQGVQLGQKAADTLRTGGMGTLVAEMRAYVRWHLDQLRDRLGR